MTSAEEGGIARERYYGDDAGDYVYPGSMTTTTPAPTGLTALIVGDAPVIHASEAVDYDAPDLDESVTDGTDDVVLPLVEPKDAD